MQEQQLNDKQIRCIAVVGVGRFGTLWAQLLAQHATAGGYRVIAYNRTPRETPDAAVQMVPLVDLAQAQLLFICTAISSLPQLLLILAPHIASDAIVCDTCSVKEVPQRWMRAMLPQNCALLGTHPMFGPDSLAHSTHRPMVYSPIRISDEKLQLCTELFALWGLEGVRMTARQHDKIAAYSQGFTHLLGRLAERMRLPETEIGTLGYRRVLQVREQTCRDEWQLFLDLQHYNRHTSGMLRRLARSLRNIRREIRRAN